MSGSNVITFPAPPPGDQIMVLKGTSTEVMHRTIQQLQGMNAALADAGLLVRSGKPDINFAQDFRWKRQEYGDGWIFVLLYREKTPQVVVFPETGTGWIAAAAPISVAHSALVDAVHEVFASSPAIPPANTPLEAARKVTDAIRLQSLMPRKPQLEAPPAPQLQEPFHQLAGVELLDLERLQLTDDSQPQENPDDH